MSSFSIVDDNDKLKYKLTSVPIFEKSQSSWNNSTKTNAFSIHTPEQSVLFTGNLSCVNYTVVSTIVVPNAFIIYYGKINNDAYVLDIYTNNFLWIPPNTPGYSGLFLINGFPAGTYLYFDDSIISDFWLISKPPNDLELNFIPGEYNGINIYPVNLIRTNDINNYLNPKLNLDITIRFNLKGTTNYIYKNLTFPDSESIPIIPINFIQTFTEMGLYDVNIYINGVNYITNSNDFLNLNATLYDLIIPPEDDNFEL